MLLSQLFIFFMCCPLSKKCYKKMLKAQFYQSGTLKKTLRGFSVSFYCTKGPEKLALFIIHMKVGKK